MSAKPKKKHYVTNAELLPALKAYQETKDPKVYDTLGIMFMKMATKILSLPNFINYDIMQKEDMVQDAVLLMIQKIGNFDFEKSSNPFAYYSEIAFNSFRQNLKDRKKDAEFVISVDYLSNLEESDGGGLED